MMYLRRKWHSDAPHHPYLLYSELDDQRWEVRKLYVYRNGTCAYADEHHEVGTWLSDQPMPSLEVINADPEFEAAAIDQEVFEAAWEQWVTRGCIRRTTVPSTS